MALPTISIETTAPFFIAFDYEFLSPALAPPRAVPMYYDRLDRMYVHDWRQQGLDKGTGYFDPIVFDPTSPMSAVVGEPDWIGLCSAGEWDRLVNTQKIYGVRVGSSNVIVEMNPITTVIEVADPYPNVGWTTTRNGKSSTTDGYYNVSNGSFLFFETLGYVICTNATVRYGGVTYTYTPIQIDLSTGDAIPIEDFVFRYVASPNAYQEEQLFGNTLTMTRMQFVPDDDCTPAQPKGFIFAFAPLRISAAGGYAHQYCKFIDWNPSSKTAAPGTLNRVHKRVTTVSRFEINEAAYPTGIDKNYGADNILYHPPSRDLRMYIGNYTGIGDPPTVDELLVIFGMSATLADITAPSQIRDVETAKTIPFHVQAFGSLGEPVGGVDVAFTLERVSTEGELLDTSGGAGSSSAVDNDPIDDDPEFPPVVYKDGVVLDSSNYTVDFVNDEFDFISPEPVGGFVYTCDYPHRTNPVSPPHGTLLNSVSQSDFDGEATAEVRYADNDDLENHLDKLSADTS